MSSSSLERQKTPVFILCGGLGTRLREETEFRPKPMVPIGDKPILLHIMSWYAKFGFRRFILCAGYKSDVIRSYFANYKAMNGDFTISLGDGSVQYHADDIESDWEITVAHTGERAMTGARVARAVARYLGDATGFAVTYGDGVTDADLACAHGFHVQHGLIGSVLGINPPSRFGEFQLYDDRLTSFAEKPNLDDKWINGGYFFFKSEFLRYLSTDDGCVLEQEPLVQLTNNGQLMVYKHGGYWGCMDTQRDRQHLNALWESGSAPWAV